MQNPDQMHPDDKRNLIIFAVLALTMWIGYDLLVARPHQEAIRQAALKAQAQQEAVMAQTPTAQLDSIVKPIDAVVRETPRLPLENKSVIGTINLKGGRLDNVELKNYYKTVEKKDHVSVLSPAHTPFPRYVETGWVAAAGTAGVPDNDTLWQVKGGKDAKLTPATPVTISYTNPEGVTFERTFSMDDDFGFAIDNQVINHSAKPIQLSSYALVTEHGQPEDFLNQGVIHEGPLGYIGDHLQERTYKNFKKKPQETFDAAPGWIGITGKYWLTAIVPDNQAAQHRFRFVSSPGVGVPAKDHFQSDVTGPLLTVAPGASASDKIHVFSGAKLVSLLDKYTKEWNAPHFDLAVDFGWYYFLTKPFFLAINFLYKLTGNFGIAIIIFTCVLRIFVFPLANTSYKSFAKMRQVSPEMYTLRHQYKDDKAKLQQELVALYQRHNVNPMAGCFPIIVQIPIFFALYKVLSNTIEMRHAPFYGWIKDLSAQDPTTIFNLFGLIPWTPPHVLMIGAWPILMMIGMIIQRNISPPPEDPIQARMVQIMPYFMTFVMAKFASGLVIYWTVNNLLAITQQIIIMRSMGVPIHLFTKDKLEKALEKDIHDGPVIHPELQAAEESIEEALTGKPVTKGTPKKKKKK